MLAVNLSLSQCEATEFLEGVFVWVLNLYRYLRRFVFLFWLFDLARALLLRMF